jgi:hypothetical protein
VLTSQSDKIFTQPASMNRQFGKKNTSKRLRGLLRIASKTITGGCAEDPDLPEFLEPLFCSKTDGVIVPVTEEMRTPSDYVWPQDSIHFGAWYTYWIEWALKNCSEPVIYLN